MAVDYKQKYQDLKAKFMSSVDTAYRVGYEQGMTQGQMQMMQQQAQQQADQMAAMQAGGGMPPGQDEAGMAPEEQADQFQQQQDEQQMDGSVSELESGIQELSELLGKGEVDKTAATAMLKSLTESLATINKVRAEQELKKNMDSIKKIGKAVGKVKNLSLSFKSNAQSHQKEALSMQKSIVEDIMKKWDEEETKATADIIKAIKG